MPVTSSNIDRDTCVLSFTAEYDEPIGRIWELWSNPRILERWWGPPTWPATFDRYEFAPGGSATFYMTGPDGDRVGGWWNILEVDAPRSLVINDGFGFTPEDAPADLPIMGMHMHLSERAGGGTLMEISTTFPSLESFEKVLAMGMLEGMTLAMGQIDDVLAE